MTNLRKTSMGDWSSFIIHGEQISTRKSRDLAGRMPALARHKTPNSVLYISFGSMNTISSSQMIQLALALEISNKNFIWVVRPPIGIDINSEFSSNWLPEGFEKRIKDSGRGLLVQKWAPQLEILSHDSISVFLSHCGWNSVLESLSFGVPLLGWAMAGEQFFNVKFLAEEVGVCVEVARGKRCEIRCEDVAEKIGIVMDDTVKGKGIRRKAMEVKEMIKEAMEDEGSSVKALDEFFKTAEICKRRGRGKKKGKKRGKGKGMKKKHFSLGKYAN